MYTKSSQLNREKRIFIFLLFCLPGALYWAMRGADGYGGISGAIIPGLMWGMAWYLLDAKNSIKSYWIGAACAVGFGIGGWNGYGQFVAWSYGKFHVVSPNYMIDINPVIGYLWMFAVGFGWGGVGGFFLSTALRPEKKAIPFIIRFLCIPIGATTGALIVSKNPQIFAPFYSSSFYAPEHCTDCARTLNTLPIVGAFCGITLTGLLYDIVRKRGFSAIVILICAFGFGSAFVIATPTQLLNQSSIRFDWWKVWEMSIGAIGGFSIACVYLLNKKIRPSASPKNNPSFLIVSFIVICWAFVNCAILVFDKTGIKMASPIPILAIALFAVFALYFLIRDYKSSIASNGIPFFKLAKKRFFVIHTILSIFSFVVTFSCKPVMTAFIILSALIYFLIATTKFNVNDAA